MEKPDFTKEKAKEETMQEMNAAAADAENDLVDVLADVPDEAVAAIAAWWKKWYMAAGHKRLGRLLMAQTGK